MRTLTISLLLSCFFVGGCPQNPPLEKKQPPPTQPIQPITESKPTPPKDPLASLAQIPSDLRKDWLSKDAQIILDLANTLPIQGADSTETLFTRFGADPKRITSKDIGFGGERHYAYRTGGYTSCYFSVLSLNKKILEATLTCRGSTDSWAKVYPVLQKLAKAPLVPSEDQKILGYYYTTEAGQQTLLDAISAELGAAPLVEEVTADLKGASDVLRKEGLTLGTFCGAGGSPPNGRRELNLLVASKSTDLLRVILRGISPEGRVYAVEGLQKLAKEGATLTAEDLSAIEKIKALTIKLSSCSGCQMEQTTAQEYLGGSRPTGAGKGGTGGAVASATSATPSADKLTFTRSCVQSGGTAAVTTELTIDAAALSFEGKYSHPTPSTKKGTILPEERASLEDLFTSAAFEQWTQEPIAQESDDPMSFTHCTVSAKSSLGEQKASWVVGAPNTPESEEVKEYLLEIFTTIEARGAAEN